MIYDENITTEETRLIQTLKGKSRMEQDQIIYEYERNKKNDTLRNDGASKRII
jgi:hypothetical protein